MAIAPFGPVASRLMPVGAPLIIGAPIIVATWTALPALTPSTWTLALRGVPLVRLLRPLTLTVRLVRLALVTVPVTPLSKNTLSLAWLVSKP